MATAIGELKKTGERCYCGEPLAWHLHELAGDVRFSHTCSNGHNWIAARDGFSYSGIRRNPFAKHDRATQAQRN